MASMTPATDRPRLAPKSRFWPRLLSALSVSAVVLAPVAAMALWLLISDPVTAAAVMNKERIVSFTFIPNMGIVVCGPFQPSQFG